MASLTKFLRGSTKRCLAALVPQIYRLLHARSWGKKTATPFTGEPKRILVLNGAHLGDVVISTSILPVLRSAYPSAEIGFVTGSWSSIVIANHPDIAFSHQVDHWSLNRSDMSYIKKLRHFRKTYAIALDEIRNTGYDMAVCVFPYFLPDYMDLAWRAGIPIRLGFTNSLFASLATSVTDLPTSPFLHQAALQAEVLRPLSVSDRHMEKRKSVLPESTEEATREVSRLLNVSDIRTANYQIVHIGAGAPNREMPIKFWRDIAVSLSESQSLLFTGRGVREAAQIARVIHGLGKCINACDKLSWDGFVAAVRYANVLYGVESMAGHVAAAVDTTSIVVYSGVAGVARWRPEGTLSTVFTNHLSCAPCGNIHGCKEMTCLKNIMPVDILSSQSIGSTSDLHGARGSKSPDR
jgi:ADP-heptose:LPS heptosyltransferase